MSLNAIKAKYGPWIGTEAVKNLLKKGLIEKDVQVKNSNIEVYTSYYRALIDKEQYEKISNKKTEITLTPKQKQVLNFILESPEELSEKQIIENLNITKTPLKSLLDKGLVEKYDKRKYRDIRPTKKEQVKEYKLNYEQTEAYNEIKSCLMSNKANGILLHGVTGSGKTSVMIKAIDKTLELGRGVIVLLPEIALTPQTVDIFGSRYGERVALVHSGLTTGQRYDAYCRIANGEVDIVIGTRSAVFAPLANLGLIIMDEEHESTYKSESNPKYHARDIARFRCVQDNATLLLASATPSIESYKKAMDGKYKLLKLKERYGNAKLPEVDIDDMRIEAQNGNTTPLGENLIKELRRVISQGEQAILFLNRRGYNNMVNCRSCGENILCSRCSVSMKYHTKKNNDNGFLFCHCCGNKIAMPKYCPKCGSEKLVRMGYGTQKIEEQLQELIPNVRVLRMDADSTTQREDYENMLTSFRDHKADILLGTQMVTKGHDFPDVTLVGVLLADMSLYLDDYHANERTFAMLTQVIGRAGRANKIGKAIIQTNNPDNEIIQMACEQNYEKMYESELRLRKLLVFPPYCDIVLLTVISKQEQLVAMGAAKLKEFIEHELEYNFPDVEIIMFGPFEAPVYKVEEKYRMRIVVKCKLNKETRQMFSKILEIFSKYNAKHITLSIDINPTGI